MVVALTRNQSNLSCVIRAELGKGWRHEATLPSLSHPVFQRIPSTNYMCAQDVHTTHIATNMEIIKDNPLLNIET